MGDKKPKVECKRITKQHYYINLSSEPAKAAVMMHLVRANWGIEKQLHRVLDAQWAENACLIHDKVGARNIAT